MPGVSISFHRFVIWSVAQCSATRYTAMIKSFAHKGLAAFFETGSKAGIRPEHAAKLRLQLGWLDVATSPQDMNLPGWRLHRLSGDMCGHWAIWVNGNWRLTFAFEHGNAEVVDYQDYH